jgi:four helix bundle protein
MQNEFKGFQQLKVWTLSRKLKIDIRDLVLTFPSSEKYNLSDQLIRSSRSVCSCIAEGHGRFTYKDQLHFCIMARGSLIETYNHLIDAFDCGYLPIHKLKQFESQIQEIHRTLNGYINFLRNQS